MDIEKRNIIAQWSFDTRPILNRFHMWLEDVEVERAQAEPVSAYTFTPRAISRCLSMTAAATALGTRLFGQFGEGIGKDKQGKEVFLKDIWPSQKEIADTIANLIDAEDIKSIDDFEPLVIEAYVTTQAAIDSLPEFDGW